MTSNGSLIKPKLYDDICKTQLDYLRISIYGPNEEKQRANTASKIKLSQIRDNIAGIKSYRDQAGYAHPFIYVKMIESKDEAENQEFLSFFEGVGDQVVIEPVMNWNDPAEGSLAQMDPAELKNKPYFEHKKDVCPFPFYTLVIHSDLKVSVCCVDWSKQAVIGNLREQTLSEIWHGEKLREFQMLHLLRRRNEISACKNCTFLHTAPDNLDGLAADEFSHRSAK